MMKAARFGRVKNTLSMGFGTFLVLSLFSSILYYIILLLCRVESKALAFVVISPWILFQRINSSLSDSRDTAIYILLSSHTIEVGLPNVGKSSLTNMLAGASHAEAANYPFCTIDPNVVQCIVPDKNFKYLADTFKSPSTFPAALKVTDIAGLIKGASEGAGLGNAFLSHIAAVDGIYHLIRDFDSDEVIHVDDSVDPIRDLETIQGELCAKDRETLSKVEDKEKERVRKEKGLARSAEPPLSEDFINAYAKCKELVDSNTPVQTGEFKDGEVELIKDWGLITTKPQIYVVNLSKKNFIRKGSKWLPKIAEWVKSHGGGQVIPVSVEFEEELFQFKDDPEGQKGMSDICF